MRVWDQACYELFDVTASKLRELWEQGVENPDDQANLLDSLNKNLGRTYNFACTARIWSHGQRNAMHQLQVNVNMIEDAAA